jgi:hypothetical protein
MKKYTRFVIPGVLLLVTVFVSGYYLWSTDLAKREQQSLENEKAAQLVRDLMTQNPSATTTGLSPSIAAWNTHRDPLLGVTYRYPSEFVHKKFRDGDCYSGPDYREVCVKVYAVEDGVTLENVGEYVPDIKNAVGGKEQTRSEIVIAGEKGLQFRTSMPEDPYMRQGWIEQEYVLAKNGDFVVYVYGSSSVVDQMISDLAFTQPDPGLSPYELVVSWNAEKEEMDETAAEIESRSCSEGRSYRVGTVTNGPLQGDSVIARQEEECGMDCGGRAQRELHHYVYHEGLQIPVGKDTGYALKDLDTPASIAIPGSAYVLTRDFASNFIDPAQIKSTLFVDDRAGRIFETLYGRCYAVERKDHALVYYTLHLPFVNEENGVMDLTRTDGRKLDEAYDYGQYWTCANVVDQPKEMREVAASSDGQRFYARMDDDPVLKALFSDQNTVAHYQHATATYKEFLDIAPILYWKDPVGRWIELKNKKYLQAAEKCKPVIYLYPKEQMEVSVYVSPNGGFTHTIPEYDEGWHVTAHPDGSIYDHASGQAYPYLYWAGWSYDTPKITKGWVVGQEHLEAFLVEKLARLGLNAKEISDFNEYWLARLRTEGAPNYKIMFLDQEEFNRLAPLRVEGEKRPDRVIRVVMYAQPSVRGEVLPPQSLPETPSRDGFTVVEWGGSLLK